MIFQKTPFVFHKPLGGPACCPCVSFNENSKIKAMMKRFFALTIFHLVVPALAFSQCETWINSPNKDAIEEAHVLYRQFMKTNEYEQAFPYWQKAYQGAPAADGQRPYHFTDGIKLYMDKFQKETDPAKKKEYSDMVIKLYNQYVECYPKDKPLAYGLMVYDLFYYLNAPYSLTSEACKNAVEAGGNNTSYTVFQPYATIVVYNFQNGLMKAEEARSIYLKLNEIADYNIANNKQYGTYYQQGKEAMNLIFAQIENEIFDCEYFKNKFEPDFNSYPDSIDLLKYIYNKLIAQGCVETDPFVAKVKAKYEEVVEAENAERLKAYYAENPGDHGIALYKEGKFDEALQKFDEAIEKLKEDGNQDKLADFYFYKASIEFRQLNRYSSARQHALKAASLRPGWGQPYMLIGDMYAASSNSCGSTAFDKQLAVLAAIDKYAYAKSIDSSVATEASKKISRYNDFLPNKDEAFMMGIKEGDAMQVPCWIGETVKVRFAN